MASATGIANGDLVRFDHFGLGADAQIQEQSGGNTPLGDQFDLGARYTPGSQNDHLLLRFDLSGITAGDLASNALSTLRLYVNRSSWPSGAATFQYYGLDPSAPNQIWNESTVTFRNAPGVTYDGDLTTRGVNATNTLLGELSMSGTKAVGTALDFSSTALSTYLNSVVSYHATNGGPATATLLVVLKDGSPTNQSFTVKSNDSYLLNSSTGNAQYNPQLVLKPPSAGTFQCVWKGGTSTWNDTAKWSSGLIPNSNGNTTYGVTIAATTIDEIRLNQNATVEQFTHTSGALEADGADRTFTVKQKINFGGNAVWSATGSSILHIEATDGIAFTGNTTIERAVVENRGRSTLTGAVYLQNATLNNHVGATIDVLNDGPTIDDATGLSGQSTSIVNNEGVIQKTVGTGFATMSAPIINTGLISVTSGTLKISGENRSMIRVGAGATLNIGLDQRTMAGSVIEGDGRVNVLYPGSFIHAGSLIIKGDFTVNGLMFFQPGSVLRQDGDFIVKSTSNSTTVVQSDTGAPLEINRLHVQGIPSRIVFQGADDFVFNTLVDWQGGGLFGKGAVLPEFRVNAGMNISGYGMQIVGRHLVNNSSINWTAGALTTSTQGTVDNLVGAVFDINGDLTSSSIAFNNFGTINRSTGNGVSLIERNRFNNDGIVNVKTGELRIVGIDPQVGNSSGVFNVDANAKLMLSRHALLAASKIQGAGQLILGTETVNVSGTVNMTGSTKIQGQTNFLAGATAASFGQLLDVTTGATATFNTGKTIDVIDLNVNGTLTGADRFNIGGKLSGSGTISVPLDVAGQLSPGNSIGQLVVNGNVALGNTASVQMEIGSAANDQINSSAGIQFGGLLQFALLDGFTPSSTRAFTLITTSSPIVGSFTNAVNGQRLVMSTGDSFLVHYGNQSTFSPNALVIDGYTFVPEPVCGIWIVSIASTILMRRRSARAA